MTQKEKELLLQDLCARLPYGVKVHIRYKEGEPCYGKLTPRDIQWFIDSKIETIKPYLRPMSSMTEEEKIEYGNLHHIEKCKHFNNVWKFDVVYSSDILFYIDWLNAHHFDYRGLIPKNLAIKVTEVFINKPYENQDNIS